VVDLQNRLRKLSVSSDDSQTTDTETSGQQSAGTSLKQVDSALSIVCRGRGSVDSSSGEPSADFMDTPRFDSTRRTFESISAYRGRTTGVEVIQGLRNLCDTFLGDSIDYSSPVANIAAALDIETPFQRLPVDSSANLSFSPRPMIHRWIDLAFSEAFTLWPFIDHDSICDQVRDMTESAPNPADWNKDQVGLLHAIIALGQRHDSNLIAFEGKRSQSEETRG
jgi:hypothetical protein